MASFRLALSRVILLYRVEFQGRGAAHIHGVIWLNIKEMEKSTIFQDEGLSNGILSEAFKKLRDDVKLTEDEKEAIVKLTDTFVSCSLNPETAHKDKELAKKLVEIIKSVNCHNCTRPCDKYGDKCKQAGAELGQAQVSYTLNL